MNKAKILNSATNNSMKTEYPQFHLPTKPYDAVTAVNRIAAAQGSVGYAYATAYADYNGHHITAYWNEYRRYYVCEHQWGERVVHARGSVRDVLETAISVYKGQGRGASLSVSVKPEDAAVALELGLVAGREPAFDWWTWKHDEAATAYRMERQVGLPYVQFLFEANTKEEYDAKIKASIAQRRKALNK